MWKTRFKLVYVLSVIVLVESTNTRRLDDAPSEEERFRNAKTAYERRHYYSYITDRSAYVIWPEVQTDYMYYCDWLLQKLFRKKDISNVTAKIWQVSLIYRETEYSEEVTVTALKCKFPKPVRKRRFVHFIRSTDPNCAFFVNRLKTSCTKFFITAEICQSRPNNTFWKIQELTQKKKSSTTKREYTTEHYEEAHARDFSLKQVDYETWPELQEKDINTYCHTLLMKTFPQSNIDISNVRPERGSIFLYYKEIERNADEDEALRKVHSLSCYLTNKSKRNVFLFIRTPEPNCVFLVKQKFARVREYHISKQFCEDVAAATQTDDLNTGLLGDDNEVLLVNQAETLRTASGSVAESVAAAVPEEKEEDLWDALSPFETI